MLKYLTKRNYHFGSGGLALSFATVPRKWTDHMAKPTPSAVFTSVTRDTGTGYRLFVEMKYVDSRRINDDECSLFRFDVDASGEGVVGKRFRAMTPAELVEWP